MTGPHAVLKIACLAGRMLNEWDLGRPLGRPKIPMIAVQLGRSKEFLQVPLSREKYCCCFFK